MKAKGIYVSMVILAIVAIDYTYVARPTMAARMLPWLWLEGIRGEPIPLVLSYAYACPHK
ncbi:MAG: hypothetical protein QXI39_01840 [Candidatus Bathyarchaeia archaeon]